MTVAAQTATSQTATSQTATSQTEADLLAVMTSIAGSSPHGALYGGRVCC